MPAAAARFRARQRPAGAALALFQQHRVRPTVCFINWSRREGTELIHGTPRFLALVPERVTLGLTPSYLLMRGPYRFTRNPMYVAELGLWLGWTIFFGSPAVLIGCLRRGQAQDWSNRCSCTLPRARYSVRLFRGSGSMTYSEVCRIFASRNIYCPHEKQ